MNQSLWSDLARASRSLRRSPGFVAIAALSLGAALGLSTAVLGFIDAMRHPESPIRNVEEVFSIDVLSRTRLGPTQAEVERQVAMLPGVAALSSARDTRSSVEVNGLSERMTVGRTRPGYFELLGRHPRLGRLPALNARDGGAVLSDALWRRRFGLLRTLGSATISVDGRQYSVVGVFPPVAIEEDAAVWIPDESPDASAIVVVRLHPGVPEQFGTQLLALKTRWAHEYAVPGERGVRTDLWSMRPNPLKLQDVHYVMLGAALAVLLIACANVAALMLARGNVRSGEYALQMALGAAPWALAREVLVEVVVLALIGSITGAVVATWAAALIGGAMPEQMTWMGFQTPQWSLRVFAQSSAAVFAAVAVAGGYPAWRASRLDPAGPLKDGAGRYTGRQATRFRLLVIAELAIAMTLLVSASLMTKSLYNQSHYEWGYDARGLLTVSREWEWNDQSPRAEREARARVLLGRLRTMPEVQSAARITSCAPTLVLSDRSAEGGAVLHHPTCRNVSAGFFSTLGVPLVAGRDFSDADAVGSALDSTSLGGAAILDEKTALRLFPHEPAVGRVIKYGSLASPSPWLRVVGVVRNQSLFPPSFPESGPDSSMVLYESTPSNGYEFGRIVIRPARGARDVAVAVHRAAQTELTGRDNARVESWTRRYDDDISIGRFLALTFTLLATAALLLGAAGLFSVIAYVATQRSREFAVRIALGASPAHVRGLVLRDAVLMSLGGTGIGAGLGMWAGFLLWDKMWGVYPVDAGALIAAEAVLLTVTLLASLLPALRASRSDPMTIIRSS
jgi:putative ABC transport system permease protein